MELKKYKLGDIADFNKRALNKSDSIKEIIYLDTSSITENVISDTVTLHVADAPSRAQRKVEHYTIIYSTVRPRLKHYGILKTPSSNLIVSTGFVTIDLKPEYKGYIDPRYLYLLLTQPSITEYIGNIADTAVSAYPSINPSDISALSFNFPEFRIQNRIADVWENYDQKIALNRAINDNLEAMAKQLYDYWFVQFDFPNEEGKPYKSSGGKMVWDNGLKREIPEGWEVKSINDLSTICRGVSYKPSDLQDNGVLILRGNNIENNHIVYDNNTAFLLSNMISAEQKIKRHDIIITMSSGSKEHIGKCAMFQIDSKHSFGAFLSKITPNKDCPHFIFLFLSSIYFKQKIKSICNGTGINNLTNQTFDEVRFAYPTPKTLKLFEKHIQSIFDTIGNNDAENEVLTKLREEILPLLMNGQVTVNYHLSDD